jgi:hypothetical protein
MSASRSEREEILRRIVTGELDPERDPARTMLAESEELQGELAELRGVEARLEGGARERDLVLAAAARAVPTPAEDAAVSAFRARAGAPEPALPRTRRRYGPVLLAAAALLAVATWVVVGRQRAENRPLPRTTLGPGAGCITPAGEVEAWGTFQWNFDLPPNGSFELSIFDATERSAGARVHLEEHLVESTWTSTIPSVTRGCPRGSRGRCSSRTGPARPTDAAAARKPGCADRPRPRLGRIGARGPVGEPCERRDRAARRAGVRRAPS